MNENPEKKDLSDKDMDELLRLLFKTDEKEKCTPKVKSRLWESVKEEINELEDKIKRKK